MGFSALAVLSLLAAGPAPEGGIFFTETFDSYANGSTISGQGGWATWDLTPTANTTVTNAQSFTSPNSLLIGGPADIVREFTGVTAGTWYAKVRVFVPSTQTGESWFIVMNQYDPSGTQNWSIQLAMCATVCSTTGVNPGFATNLGGSNNPGIGSVALVTNQWVEIRAEINLTANTYSLFYNNTLVETATYQATGANEVAAFDLFSNGSSNTFMDNVWLDETVPVELQTFAVE